MPQQLGNKYAQIGDLAPFARELYQLALEHAPTLLEVYPLLADLEHRYDEKIQILLRGANQALQQGDQSEKGSVLQMTQYACVQHLSESAQGYLGNRRSFFSCLSRVLAGLRFEPEYMSQQVKTRIEEFQANQSHSSTIKIAKLYLFHAFSLPDARRQEGRLSPSFLSDLNTIFQALVNSYGLVVPEGKTDRQFQWYMKWLVFLKKEQQWEKALEITRTAQALPTATADWEKRVKIGKHLLEIHKHCGSPAGRRSAVRYLGGAYIAGDKYSEAGTLYQKSINSEKHNREFCCGLWERLIGIYYELHRYDDAVRASFKAYSLAASPADRAQYYRSAFYVDPDFKGLTALEQAAFKLPDGFTLGNGLPNFLSETAIGPNTRALMWGHAVWNQRFPCMKVKPRHLSSQMEQILTKQCPIDATKQVWQTHILILMPPLSGKSLEKEMQGRGAHWTIEPYNDCQQAVEKIRASTLEQCVPWVLMTREVIPGSEGKTYDEQVHLLQEKGGYKMPEALELITALRMDRVQDLPEGNRLAPLEGFVRCADKAHGGSILVGKETEGNRPIIHATQETGRIGAFFYHAGWNPSAIRRQDIKGTYGVQRFYS